MANSVKEETCNVNREPLTMNAKVKRPFITPDNPCL